MQGWQWEMSPREKSDHKKKNCRRFKLSCSYEVLYEVCMSFFSMTSDLQMME